MKVCTAFAKGSLHQYLLTSFLFPIWKAKEDLPRLGNLTFLNQVLCRISSVPTLLQTMTTSVMITFNIQVQILFEREMFSKNKINIVMDGSQFFFFCIKQFSSWKSSIGYMYWLHHLHYYPCRVLSHWLSSYHLPSSSLRNMHSFSSKVKQFMSPCSLLPILSQPHKRKCVKKWRRTSHWNKRPA